MIGILDMEMGNLSSVSNALRFVGGEPVVVRGPGEMKGLSHLIVPGVGSFRRASENLNKSGLMESVRGFAGTGKPVLGLCLGMQLLSQEGEEGGISQGFGLIPGRTVRLSPGGGAPLPHVGWNTVAFLSEHPVFRGVKDGADFYFVHSYHVECDGARRLGKTSYGGQEFCSIVGRENVLGFQFHPEKSQPLGLKLLENFCDWDGAC